MLKCTRSVYKNDRVLFKIEGVARHFINYKRKSVKTTFKIKSPMFTLLIYKSVIPQSTP